MQHRLLLHILFWTYLHFTYYAPGSNQGIVTVNFILFFVFILGFFYQFIFSGICSSSEDDFHYSPTERGRFFNLVNTARRKEKKKTER